MAIDAISSSLMSSLSNLGKPDPNDISNKTFSRLDKNGDGVISQDELGTVNSKLADADSDGDGKITPTELLNKISATLQANGGPSLVDSSGQPDANNIKQILTQLGQSQSSSGSSGTQSSSDLITELLNSLGLTQQDTSSLLSYLNDNGLSVSA